MFAQAPRQGMYQAPTLQNATEVPHSGWLKLYPDGVAGGAILEHQGTGEVVKLQPPAAGTGRPWALSFSEGLGFLWDGSQSTWVSSLLAFSLWDDAQGQRFVLEKSGKAIKALRWFHELLNQSQAKYFVLEPQPRQCTSAAFADFVAKVIIFQVPRSACSVFWNLVDMQKSVWVSQDSWWVSRGMQRWLAFLGKLGLSYPPEHVMIRQLIQDDRRYSVFATSCTTPVLIALMLYWATCCKVKDAAKAGPIDLLRCLLHQGICPGRHPITCHTCQAPGKEVSSLQLQLVQGQGTMKLEGGLDQLGFGDGSTCPLQILVDGFATALRAKAAPPRLLTLVHGIAHLLDQGVVQQGLATDPLEVLPLLLKRRRPGAPVDPDLQQAVEALEGTKARNTSQVCRVAQALKLDIHRHSWIADARAQRRYLLACRRRFSCSRSLSISIDAKRFGGKHWLAGCMYSYEEDVSCWAPPMAIALAIQELVLLGVISVPGVETFKHHRRFVAFY